MFGRPSSGVGIDQFALEELIKPNDSTTDDAVAVVDGEGKGIVGGSIQIEVSAGMSLTPNGGSGVKGAAPDEVSLDDHGFQ